jgi:hypothetical protein
MFTQRTCRVGSILSSSSVGLSFPHRPGNRMRGLMVAFLKPCEQVSVEYLN